MSEAEFGLISAAFSDELEKIAISMNTRLNALRSVAKKQGALRLGGAEGGTAYKRLLRQRDAFSGLAPRQRGPVASAGSVSRALAHSNSEAVRPYLRSIGK